MSLKRPQPISSKHRQSNSTCLLKLNTQTGDDFILFGKGIGLVDKLIKKILDEACSEKHCDLVITTIENSFMNEKDKAKVISCFKGRIKAIKHIVYAAI